MKSQTIKRVFWVTFLASFTLTSVLVGRSAQSAPRFGVGEGGMGGGNGCMFISAAFAYQMQVPQDLTLKEESDGTVSILSSGYLKKTPDGSDPFVSYTERSVIKPVRLNAKLSFSEGLNTLKAHMEAYRSNYGIPENTTIDFTTLESKEKVIATSWTDGSSEHYFYAFLAPDQNRRTPEGTPVIGMIVHYQYDARDSQELSERRIWSMIQSLRVDREAPFIEEARVIEGKFGQDGDFQKYGKPTLILNGDNTWNQGFRLILKIRDDLSGVKTIDRSSDGRRNRESLVTYKRMNAEGEDIRGREKEKSDTLGFYGLLKPFGEEGLDLYEFVPIDEFDPGSSNGLMEERGQFPGNYRLSVIEVSDRAGNRAEYRIDNNPDLKDGAAWVKGTTNTTLFRREWGHWFEKPAEAKWTAPTVYYEDLLGTDHTAPEIVSLKQTQPIVQMDRAIPANPELFQVEIRDGERLNFADDSSETFESSVVINGLDAESGKEILYLPITLKRIKRTSSVQGLYSLQLSENWSFDERLQGPTGHLRGEYFVSMITVKDRAGNWNSYFPKETALPSNGPVHQETPEKIRAKDKDAPEHFWSVVSGEKSIERPEMPWLTIKFQNPSAKPRVAVRVVSMAAKGPNRIEIKLSDTTAKLMGGHLVLEKADGSDGKNIATELVPEDFKTTQPGVWTLTVPSSVIRDEVPRDGIYAVYHLMLRDDSARHGTVVRQTDPESKNTRYVSQGVYGDDQTKDTLVKGYPFIEIKRDP